MPYDHFRHIQHHDFSGYLWIKLIHPSKSCLQPPKNIVSTTVCICLPPSNNRGPNRFVFTAKKHTLRTKNPMPAVSFSFRLIRARMIIPLHCIQTCNVPCHHSGTEWQMRVSSNNSTEKHQSKMQWSLCSCAQDWPVHHVKCKDCHAWVFWGN